LRLLKLKFFATRNANQFIDQLLDSAQPYMVFPLQMQNDFQIRAYSKYDNLEQAIEEVIESFAANAPAAMNLVIKVHPLDPGMISWRRICMKAAQNHGVESRVHYIEGGCLDTLLESCQGVVTINSTVGVWSLRQSKPLYVLGEAVFKVAGLVHQGALDDFWSAPQPPEPALLEAFMRAIAATIHIRGVYYSQPGLANAVDEAVYRLLENKINQRL
jgi:capsular polysaccharide export protein